MITEPEPIDPVLLVGPIEVTVKADGDCEQGDFLVCALVQQSSMLDDVHGATCCVCGAGVVHRPYAPTLPQRICYGCFTMKFDAKDVVCITSPRMAADLKARGIAL